MGGRIDVEADHVVQLLDKGRIVRAFERAHPMRLQTVRLPDPLDGAQRDLDPLGHRGDRPVGHLAGWLERVSATTSATVRGGGMPGGRVLSRSRPSTPSSAVALLPAPDGCLGHAGFTHDRMRAQAIGAQQHDTGPPDVLLRRVPVSYEGFKPQEIRGGEREREATAHPTRLAGRGSYRNPRRTQPSDFSH